MCLLFLIIYKYTIKNDIGKDLMEEGKRDDVRCMM